MGSAQGRVGWAIYAVAWTVYAAVLAAVRPPAGIGQLVLFTGPAALSAAAILVAVVVRRPARPGAWICVACAMALSALGDAVWLWYELRGLDPFPSLADIAYLASYPVLLVGVSSFVRARRADRDPTDLLDAGMVSVSAALVVWVFLAAPSAADPSLSTTGRAVALAYPLLGALVLSSVVRLALGGGERAPAYYLIVAGSSALVVTEFAFAARQLSGTYLGGGILDLGWIATWVLWGTAALHPSMRTLSEPRPAAPGRLGAGRVAMLWATALLAPVALAVAHRQGRHVDRWLELGVVVLLITLLVLRMWYLLRITGGLARREIEDRMRALVHHIDEAVLVLDDGDRVTYASPAAETLRGADGTVRWDLLAAHGDRAALRAAVSRVRTGDDEVLEVRGDPVRRPGRLYEVALDDLRADPGVAGVVVTCRDITARRTLEAQVLQQAYHDPLTGLADRRLLLDGIRALLASGRGGALLFVDLDDFKGVNDRLGHDAGDALLRAVADRLRGVLRGGDLAARLGGDEFAVLTGAGEADALALAGRLVGALTRPAALEGQLVELGASVGVAVARPGAGGAGDAADASTLLRQADTAMYAAKAGGGHRFERFDTRLHEQAVRRVGRTADLRRALAGEQLWLGYQPVAWLGPAGGTAGYAARLSWDHESGPLGAAEFLPLAEEVGLSRGIGRWMVEHACREAAGWAGATAHEPFVAVDVPVGQVRDRLLRDVEHALTASGLAPARLVVQVPERALAGDVAAIEPRLRGLAALGVRLSVAGFGTGETSPAGLHRLPLDAVELDPALVAAVDRDEQSAALVRGVLDLARRLDLVTVAPAVDRPAQRDLLAAWGCTLAHGDLIGGALPAVEVRALRAAHVLASPAVA